MDKCMQNRVIQTQCLLEPYTNAGGSSHKAVPQPRGTLAHFTDAPYWDLLLSTWVSTISGPPTMLLTHLLETLLTVPLPLSLQPSP